MTIKNKSKIILNKPISKWISDFPMLTDILSYNEIFWTNNFYSECLSPEIIPSISLSAINDASNRLDRFAPYIMKAFPETIINNGLIESPFKKIGSFLDFINLQLSNKIEGSLYLKCDSHLPISGSIKARGGIYEILKHAETLALENNLLTVNDDYSILSNSSFKEFFSDYSIAVGSTGNLGLSIGIISAKLGFNVTVHMSSDAKQWKKDLLRAKGVHVIEHNSDYSVAVAEGRIESLNNPNCYFVDDEKSKDLFLGYSVAALRLKSQLESNNILVDKTHPLFVYLPCGVGGGPGGVAFGLKQLFGENVHCFFAEPTHSPCLLLGLMTDKHDSICVQDFGLDNKTAADGLAVGRPSGLVSSLMKGQLSGCFTISDNTLYSNLAKLTDTENIRLEPSALAGLSCISNLYNSSKGIEYLSSINPKINSSNITHIAWATGGNMVPDSELKHYYSLGKNINNSTE